MTGLPIELHLMDRNTFRRRAIPLLEAWIAKQKSRPIREHGTTAVLTDDEITQFFEAALRRNDPLWDEMEAVLKELEPKHPFRVAQARTSIRWIRKMALKQGVPWGRKG